jgi:AraC family transcriptional regulator
MATLHDIQPAIAHAAQNRDQRLTLQDLAAQSNLSPFQFHRAFTSVASETPKQYTLRLRLEQAAALLQSTSLRIVDIAFACGFESHEVFIRAFRRRFHATPQAFRQRNSISPQSARLLREIGPCLHFYRYSLEDQPNMPYTIEAKQLPEQPILAVRKRVKREEIAATIGGSLGAIVTYAMQNSSAISGHPVTRYLEMGAGMVTMEPAMRVSQHPPADPSGNVLNELLPAGLTAVTTHMGPYDQLPAAYGAIEVWMHENGYVAAGAPWEDYVTDPGEVPDPQQWRTDVYWPVRSSTGK